MDTQTITGICTCGHTFEDHSEWTLGNGDLVDKCLICDCLTYIDENEQ